MSTTSPLDDDDPDRSAGPEAASLQEFYIPVHGYVRLRPEEVAVVDHPAFQRLRKCRQLGFAHLVFPGASHSRFEHSLGTLYVAEKMVQYVNFNFRKSTARREETLPLCEIKDDVRNFIRLAALLHDIGHIPFGHTLEDELRHLPKHDGAERINKLCWRPAEGYVPRVAFGERPPEQWSLAAVINAAYGPSLNAIYPNAATEDFTPFDLLKAIIARTDVPEGLAQVFPLSVARDLVGNTICADFLDYLFRDWYHIGKPMTEDRRLYQYMEVRARCPDRKCNEQQFVINIGPDQKLRHDALTCILELLEGRYKLAETVLFHRSKLAMTALLDRCFLELGYVFELSGVEKEGLKGRELFAHLAVEHLSVCADDDLPNVIRGLADYVRDHVKANKPGAAKLARARKSEPSLALEAVSAADGEETREKAREIHATLDLIGDLARRFENRTTYTLATRFPRRRIDGSERRRNDRAVIPDQLKVLGDPTVRRDQVKMVEELLNLDPGSVTIYAPTDARMNAKLAEVKLLIGDQILSFVDYEGRDDALSCGMLEAQRNRFNELWGVSLYCERTGWQRVLEERGARLPEALEHTIYIKPSQRSQSAEKRDEFRELDWSQAAHNNPAQRPVSRESKYKGRQFASGLPFDRRNA